MKAQGETNGELDRQNLIEENKVTSPTRRFDEAEGANSTKVYENNPFQAGIFVVPKMKIKD